MIGLVAGLTILVVFLACLAKIGVYKLILIQLTKRQKMIDEHLTNFNLTEFGTKKVTWMQGERGAWLKLNLDFLYLEDKQTLEEERIKYY